MAQTILFLILFYLFSTHFHMKLYASKIGIFMYFVSYNLVRKSIESIFLHSLTSKIGQKIIRTRRGHYKIIVLVSQVLKWDVKLKLIQSTYNSFINGIIMRKEIHRDSW